MVYDLFYCDQKYFFPNFSIVGIFLFLLLSSSSSSSSSEEPSEGILVSPDVSSDNSPGEFGLYFRFTLLFVVTGRFGNNGTYLFALCENIKKCIFS